MDTVFRRIKNWKGIFLFSLSLSFSRSLYFFPLPLSSFFFLAFPSSPTSSLLCHEVQFTVFILFRWLLMNTATRAVPALVPLVKWLGVTRLFAGGFSRTREKRGKEKTGTVKWDEDGRNDRLGVDGRLCDPERKFSRW